MLVLRKATSATATMGSSSVQILAANDRRHSARIVNPSDVGIWIGYGAAAVIGTGDYIPAGGGVLEISEFSGMWRGTVTGIAASGTGKVIGSVEFQ